MVLQVHSLKIMGWNLKITQLKRKVIFQTIIFRFHVNLPGCKPPPFWEGPKKCRGFWVDLDRSRSACAQPAEASPKPKCSNSPRGPMAERCAHRFNKNPMETHRNHTGSMMIHVDMIYSYLPFAKKKSNQMLNHPLVSCHRNPLLVWAPQKCQ